MTTYKYKNFSPGAADASELWSHHLRKPLLYPREGTLSTLLQSIRDKLQRLCKTDSEVLMLTTAGTGALECAIAALPSDKRLLVIQNGAFGDRMAQIAKFHDFDLTILDLGWGIPYTSEDEAELERICKETKIDIILAVHLETSTTLLNDVASIGKVAGKIGAMTIIDGISAIGCSELNLFEWGIDCYIACPYKALLCPAGLSLILANDRFLESAQNRWSYYFDIQRQAVSAQKGTYLWTPNVSILNCLEDVLTGIFTETEVTYFKRIENDALFFRDKLKEAGLQVVGSLEVLSPCFTGIDLENHDADLWLKRLKDDHGIIIGKGMGESADRMLRIGHYPHRTREELGILAEAIVQLNL